MKLLKWIKKRSPKEPMKNIRDDIGTVVILDIIKKNNSVLRINHFKAWGDLFPLQDRDSDVKDIMSGVAVVAYNVYAGILYPMMEIKMDDRDKTDLLKLVKDDVPWV